MTGTSLVIAAIVVVVAWLLLTEPWAPRLSAVRRKYAREGSRYFEVEGIDVHSLVEGPPEGPPVIVLPSHWGHFAQWDDWADALTDRYRVIRIDLPGHGLTSPVPSGDYSMAMYIRVLFGVADELGLARFAVAGTSFSGIVAFRAAAAEPDRIAALILANASGLPRKPGGASPNAPPPNWFHRLIYPYYRPRGFFAWKLSTLILNADRLTPERISLYTALNNVRGRIGEDKARVKAYDRGDPQATLAAVRAPTLIQGSSGSTYLSSDDADTFESWIVNAPTEKHTYGGAGHLIVDDCPEALVADARRFLDGLPAAQWRVAG